MTYTGTICTEAEIALMAGANVGAGATEANNNILVAHAEGYLTGLIQFDVVANWAAISGSATLGPMLSEWAARYAGMSLIANDMSGFESRTEAESMINIHVFRMKEIKEELLKGEVLKQMGAS